MKSIAEAKACFDSALAVAPKHTESMESLVSSLIVNSIVTKYGAWYWILKEIIDFIKEGTVMLLTYLFVSRYC